MLGFLHSNLIRCFVCYILCFYVFTVRVQFLGVCDKTNPTGLGDIPAPVPSTAMPALPANLPTQLGPKRARYDTCNYVRRCSRLRSSIAHTCTVHGAYSSSSSSAFFLCTALTTPLSTNTSRVVMPVCFCFWCRSCSSSCVGVHLGAILPRSCVLHLL